jgi:glycosyltransferase involved in cell wall biosynthesis
VIYQGLDPRFTQPPTPEAVREFRRRTGLERPYILFVGTLEPRKNLVRLLEAYRLLVEQHGIPHDLVICGALGWHTGPIRQALGESAVRERVHLAGYVSDSELPLWYAAADLFVYPSLFEGFGLPPLEAMACGTPVVLSNAPSLLEVAGGADPQRDQAAALLVDPFDPQAIAGGLAQVLCNAELAERLRTRGIARAQTFDWASAARRMVQVYREILEQA